MNAGIYLYLLICVAYCISPANSAGCCSPPPASPRPSKTPTFAPTRLPSPSPTRKPTRGPTPRPTKLPSAIPTRRPTRAPTFAPSDVPSEEPTYMPSQPTSQPSSTPTTVTPRPSPRPSIAPSATPTCTPTVKPTSNPTITPTRTPTNQPTESPTISCKPTAFPTFVPSPRPINAPSTAPSARPSKLPTAMPSEEPTLSPSTAVATVVSISISQVLVNIDAVSFSNSSANAHAFQLAVSESIEGIKEEDVSIESVTDSTGATSRFAWKAHKRYLRETSHSVSIVMMEAPQITIEYLIAFVMEELGYDNGTLALRYAASHLSGAVGDGSFLESLRAAALLLGADEALLNVTSTSVVVISSSASILRSATPSARPTSPVHSSADSAAKFENWNKGVQAIVIIIVILVFFVLVAVTCQYMQRYSWFSTAYSQVEVVLFGMVGARLHSAYLQNNGSASNRTGTASGDEEAPSQQETGTNSVVNALSVTSNVETLDAGAEVEEIQEKREYRSLLFLSRHSEATEALMNEMEATIYGAMPWLQHERDDDYHPLTHGIAEEDLPVVKPAPVTRPAQPPPMPPPSIPAEAGCSAAAGDHSADGAESDGDLSFYDCVPLVNIIPPGGVPVISRHCASTENMIAGIEELLSRAGLSLIDDQEEKEGEHTENSEFSYGQAPAKVNFVRTEPHEQVSAPVEYTDMLSTLIARSRCQTDAPLCVELPAEPEVYQENDQDQASGQDSPEEKADSSVGSTFHYVDALSALIANSKAENASADAATGEPDVPQNIAESGPLPVLSHGGDSPFISLSTVPFFPSDAPLAMETTDIPAEPAISSAGALEAPLDLVLAMEAPQESPRSRDAANALSPRSADDSELGRLNSPSFSILSGDSHFSLGSGVTADTRAPGGDGSALHNVLAVSALAGGSDVAGAGGAQSGDAEVKVLRKVNSRRGGGMRSPRSPRDSTASFTKPKSPTKEAE